MKPSFPALLPCPWHISPSGRAAAAAALIVIACVHLEIATCSTKIAIVMQVLENGAKYFRPIIDRT